MESNEKKECHTVGSSSVEEYFLIDDVEKLKDELTELKNEFAEESGRLLSKNAKLVKEIEELKLKKDEFEKELKDCSEYFGRISGEKDAKLEEQSSRFSRFISALRQELGELQERLSEKEGELHSLRLSKSRLEKELEAVSENLEKVSRNYNELSSSLSVESFDEMNDKICVLEDEVEEANSNFCKMNNELSAIIQEKEAEIERLNGLLGTERRKVIEWKAVVEKFQNEMKFSELTTSEIADLKNEVLRKSEMIQALEKENDNFHNLLAQNRSESLSLAKDLVQYRNQLVESKEKIFSLSQENDRLVWLLDSKEREISSLKMGCEREFNLAEECSSLLSENESLKEQILKNHESYCEDISKANSRIESLENEVKNLLSGNIIVELEKCSELSSTIEKLKAEKDSLERELIESATRIDSVKSFALCLKSTIESDLLQLALQLKELESPEQQALGIRTIHVLSDFYKINNRFLELSTVEQKAPVAEGKSVNK